MYEQVNDYRIAYHRYLRSDKWANKRRAVLQRFNYTCAKCGKRHVLFNVHHLTYARIFNEPLTDLILLCEPCHFALHNTMQKGSHNKIINALPLANKLDKRLVTLLLKFL